MLPVIAAVVAPTALICLKAAGIMMAADKILEQFDPESNEGDQGFVEVMDPDRRHERMLLLQKKDAGDAYVHVHCLVMAGEDPSFHTDDEARAGAGKQAAEKGALPLEVLYQRDRENRSALGMS